MAHHTFKIQVELTVECFADEPSGFWARVPVLKGCHSDGETLEELKSNIQESAAGFIEFIEEEGYPEELP